MQWSGQTVAEASLAKVAADKVEGCRKWVAVKVAEWAVAWVVDVPEVEWAAEWAVAVQVAE
jgi:hypothetical protein